MTRFIAGAFITIVCYFVGADALGRAIGKAEKATRATYQQIEAGMAEGRK